jgi:hypothetical protein
LKANGLPIGGLTTKPLPKSAAAAPSLIASEDYRKPVQLVFDFVVEEE